MSLITKLKLIVWTSSIRLRKLLEKFLERLIVDYGGSFPCEYHYKRRFGFVVKDNILFYLGTVKLNRRKKKYLKSSIFDIGYFKLSSLAVDMVSNPVMTYKDGKRIGITNLRAAKEYAKRNGLEFGSDDLEQEANRNRDNIDKEHTERLANRVTEDFLRLQRMKREQ